MVPEGGRVPGAESNNISQLVAIPNINLNQQTCAGSTWQAQVGIQETGRNWSRHDPELGFRIFSKDAERSVNPKAASPGQGLAEAPSSCFSCEHRADVSQTPEVGLVRSHSTTEAFRALLRMNRHELLSALRKLPSKSGGGGGVLARSNCFSLALDHLHSAEASCGSLKSRKRSNWRAWSSWPPTVDQGQISSRDRWTGK